MSFFNPKSVKQISISKPRSILQTKEPKPGPSKTSIISLDQQPLIANPIPMPPSNPNNTTPINQKKDPNLNISCPFETQLKTQCAESVNMPKASKPFGEEFMSVGGGAFTQDRRRSKKTHKKGNQSMNLRSDVVQQGDANMIDDFDLQTLDLGDSEIKT